MFLVGSIGGEHEWLGRLARRVIKRVEELCRGTTSDDGWMDWEIWPFALKAQCTRHLSQNYGGNLQSNFAALRRGESLDELSAALASADLPQEDAVVLLTVNNRSNALPQEQCF